MTAIKTTTAATSSNPQDRIIQRLEALGVSLASIANDGKVSMRGRGRWIEHLVLQTPQCRAAVRERLGDLRAPQGAAVQVWPGLWLLPLPAPRGRYVRKTGHDRALDESLESAPLVVAVALGPELVESEQLRMVCDVQETDLAATISRIDPTTLVTEAEAHRLEAAIAWMGEDALENQRRWMELQSLSQQLGESYEELSLLYTLSSSMIVNQEPDRFLTDACSELREVVGLKWMALQLIENEPRLNRLSGRHFTAGTVDCDPSLFERISKSLLALATAPGSNGRPLIVDDTESLRIPHVSRISRSLMVISLRRDTQCLGILFGGDKPSGSHITSVDSKLCNSLANSLVIFLENTMLYEDMQAMFLGTLHALTASIDAKDSYTHGHSERVALLSRMLAVAAGLEEPVVERVYLAALVHDVGKIGVPEAVLCKPGRLTEEEFALIRKHPQIGATILQDIRQMQDLIPGVLHHHERWDGQGYPDGLEGRDIPLFGRIICLADSYDAMRSHRTYRRILTSEQALGEIIECGGKQFDADLARTFVALDFTPFARMLSRHEEQYGETVHT